MITENKNSKVVGIKLTLLENPSPVTMVTMAAVIVLLTYLEDRPFNCVTNTPSAYGVEPKCITIRVRGTLFFYIQ